MAEAKSKSKTVVCTLCDKPITTGKPVIIDDDPFHADCAKAMEQSSGATEADEEDEDEVEEDEDEDGEDEGDEDEEDEEEDEKPAPKRAPKVAAKAPAKSAKRVVAEEEDDEDEDDEDEDEDDEDEEEEEVVAKPVAKKAVAKKATPVKASKRVVEEEDDEDEDDEDDEDDEEEEEVVVRKPAAKTATKKAPVVAKAKASTKRAAADEDEEYEEEDEPEARPTKAKTAVAKKPKAPAVDQSGWGNPATYATKRYFTYQALKEVTKTTIDQPDGPGKPEVAIARAKRLQREWARENGTTLSEKDKNFTSMNIGWIYNHAAELKLVMRHNEEAGTYRILKAAVSDD